MVGGNTPVVRKSSMWTRSSVITSSSMVTGSPMWTGSPMISPIVSPMQTSSPVWPRTPVITRTAMWTSSTVIPAAVVANIVVRFSLVTHHRVVAVLVRRVGDRLTAAVGKVNKVAAFSDVAVTLLHVTVVTAVVRVLDRVLEHVLGWRLHRGATIRGGK